MGIRVRREAGEPCSHASRVGEQVLLGAATVSPSTTRGAGMPQAAAEGRQPALTRTRIPMTGCPVRSWTYPNTKPSCVGTAGAVGGPEQAARARAVVAIHRHRVSQSVRG